MASSDRKPTHLDLFTPKSITVLREGYGFAALRADAVAGLTVAIVALPLSMAIAIAFAGGEEGGVPYFAMELVEGVTLGEVLRALAGQHPETQAQLFGADGDLNRYVNVYLNAEDVRVLDGLETAVAESDTVVILPAMAGGTPL